MPVTDTTTSAEHAFLDEPDKKLWNAAELTAQFAESVKLEAQIKKNLEGLGYVR